jgi:hypothetical protein
VALTGWQIFHGNAARVLYLNGVTPIALFSPSLIIVSLVKGIHNHIRSMLMPTKKKTNQ